MENRKTEIKKRKYGFMLAAAILLFAAAAYISCQVGSVYECGVTPLDRCVQDWFFSLRSTWLNALVIPLTHTSDTITIVVLCIILVVSPFPGRKKYGFPVTLAALSGLAIYKPMKHLFLRPRPDVSLHLVEQGGFSFPSGHSVTSVIVFGLLFYLIRKHCNRPVLRNVLSGICLLLAVLVGPSRIHVGVHWPTDVLAGWCIGGGVLLIFLVILDVLDTRKFRGKEQEEG